MDINKKIEEIRQKPEHERIRYVWGMVAVSMFFVILLWIVSLKDNFSSNYSGANDENRIEQEIGLEEALSLEE